MAVNRARIWRTGRHTPTKNSQGYPRGFIVDRKYPANRPEVSRHPVAEGVSRQGRSWRQGANKGGCNCEKKLIIFTLVYGFTYSHWYRSDRWPTHPWALTNIHNKCVNRVKHFLVNTHMLLLSYTLFKVACIISAFFVSPVFDSSSKKNECGGRT